MIKKYSKTFKHIALTILYPILALAIVLSVWAIASAIKNNPLVLPMPSVALDRFIVLYNEKRFWISIGMTLYRTTIAFLVSFIFAYILAVLADMFAPVKKTLSPIVSILRAAPTVAVIYIFYAFMSNKSMTIVVGFLIAFPIMYANFESALQGKDSNLLKMSNVYHVRKTSILLNVYFLSVADYIFDTARSTLSLTLKVVIAAEILTSVVPSVGGKIQVAYSSFEVEYLLAWTILAIVLSFVVELFVFALKKLCIRWK